MEGAGSRAEPSMLGVNITDGAESKAEPSTQRADIAEGSDTRGRTVHAGGMYRGWFRHQGANRPRWGSISWTVRSPKRNLPR